MHFCMFQTNLGGILKIYRIIVEFVGGKWKQKHCQKLCLYFLFICSCIAYLHYTLCVQFIIDFISISESFWVFPIWQFAEKRNELFIISLVIWWMFLVYPLIRIPNSAFPHLPTAVGVSRFFPSSTFSYLPSVTIRSQ